MYSHCNLSLPAPLPRAQRYPSFFFQDQFRLKFRKLWGFSTLRHVLIRILSPPPPLSHITFSDVCVFPSVPPKKITLFLNDHLNDPLYIQNPYL